MSQKNLRNQECSSRLRSLCNSAYINRDNQNTDSSINRLQANAMDSHLRCARTRNNHDGLPNQYCQFRFAQDDFSRLVQKFSRQAPKRTFLWLQAHMPLLPAPDIISPTRQCSTQRPRCTLIFSPAFPCSPLASPCASATKLCCWSA